MLRLLSRFLSATKGNVAMMFGLTAVPLIFGLGMGVDYSSAAQRRLRINAIADATALFAVTPTQLALPNATVHASAVALFEAQVTGMYGVQYTPGTVNVTITPSTNANGGITRSVTVSYTALSTNAFGGILGVKTIAIGGISASNGSFAPNIDFYLMIDDSPSMAIGATTTDMNNLMALTQSQGGCAFGCHESNAKQYDTGLGNPGGEDNYALAKSQNPPITLRIDVVNNAVQQMIKAAQTPPSGVTYRMGSYTFDYFVNQLAPSLSGAAFDPTNSTQQRVENNLSDVKTLTANLNVVTVFKPGWITSSINDNEADTNFGLALNDMNSIIPKPGNGTIALGDTPQAVLFIVSDGVVDEPNGSVGSRIISAINLHQDLCTTIKNRGIRIAFLYTTYVPIPSNYFYNDYVAPFQSSIGSPYAQACASPGLYTEVDSNGDIVSALQNLFNAATKTAHLTQ